MYIIVQILLKLRLIMEEKNIIGIISDSHDDRDGIRKAVGVFNNAGCSLVIHAGDFIAPFTAIEFGRLACPLIGVFGNNDGEKNGLTVKFSSIGEIHPGPHEFEYAGIRFVVMHEPDSLDKYIQRDNVDVIVYGHLHKVDIRRGKPLVINPGESCSWLTGRPTVVLLDLDTMVPELIDLSE